MYNARMELATEPPAILALIADPHRWRLLAELARSDRRVGELTALMRKPQNLVSYHLAELRKAGLVTARRSSADGRDIYYRADVIRCRDLLGDTGAALHPGLRLVPPPPGDVAARRRPPRVLFLCTGNSARSQIAEALLEHRSNHTIAARSAGSDPKPLHPNAVRVMAERGIDIAGHGTTHLMRFAHMRFERVITLCDKVREICPEFPGAPSTAHWSIPDPAADGDTDEATYPAFRRVADDVEVRIALLIDELTARPAERTGHAQ
jgi:ArsR family transcriptional regulator, arsenate/arsenite/antimonite-responsive transcriptional repressor / arsenate reductase (thioredoxin)